MKLLRELSVEPLTHAAFAPYGDVIEAAANAPGLPINAGSCMRHHDLAAVDCEHGGGRAGLSIFRGQPWQLPITIALLERHPLGSQAFMPLGGAPYLVVVATTPAARPRAFLARAGQGVSYRRGTWHHPLLALETTSDFLVVDRIGPGKNCEVERLDPPWRIAQYGQFP